MFQTNVLPCGQSNLLSKRLYLSHFQNCDKTGAQVPKRSLNKYDMRTQILRHSRWRRGHDVDFQWCIQKNLIPPEFSKLPMPVLIVMEKSKDSWLPAMSAIEIKVVNKPSHDLCRSVFLLPSKCMLIPKEVQILQSLMERRQRRLSRNKCWRGRIESE